ncbi:MAG: helix-turn-helix transcriptional regulator [Oscillospiraceae bacterium]
MGFAKNLTNLQAEHGETNYRLAKEIDVTQTSVKSWNTGERLPHPKTRKKIAEHYGITVEELMREDE